MSQAAAKPDAPLEDRPLGPSTTVLYGARGGRYPQGNSLLVRGPQEAVLVDPSLGMVLRRERLPRVDRVVHSHCHEDHVAGSFLFPAVPWHFHAFDLPGIRSLDGLMAIYGYGGEVEARFREVVVEQFHFTPRADPLAFRDGDVFDLGGGVGVRVMHAPGHTRGHSFFHVEPDDVLYLGDVDLSSFGPYYGDAWSDLEDFERTLRRARELEARWYATFHHVGVLEGRDEFLPRLDRFAAVIADRERRLVAYLSEPRSLDEIARHRFVYRATDAVSFAEPVERRSMAQHVARLVAAGRVEEVEPGRFRAV
ncbi:MAG TPA: MBL fold metallo-hydrolase [Myxococcota bacterium]|jgi:glyoxylase-like metal-dependent hydrolase (beta-lactamase superfamily II)|nr:MBL fold metallo-hydrolase [Myxococcota bacterium]